MPEGTCECRRLATFILVGPVYNNALTNCAALVSPGGPSLALRAIQLVPRLRRVNRMCSSTVSVNCEKAEEVMQEQPDCRSPFRSGRRSLVCARLSNKGKAGVQRGRKTAGCPSFLPTAVGTASSPRRAPHSPALRRAQLPAEVQRKTLCPLG